jgi:hypothetical protein
MLRLIAVAGFVLLASAPSRADEVCVACEEPAAIYRCSVESLPQQANKLGLADKAQGEMCQTVLAKNGQHSSCSVVADGKTCEGSARTVTLSDYQRAIAGDNEITYQPGMLEIAQHNVVKTWVCISSLFQDC